MNRIGHFIDGEFVQSEAILQGINPASEELIYQVANASKSDVDMAVAAAKKSFHEWSSSSAEYRAACLLKLADLIEDNLEHLAHCESVDTGKPLAMARAVDIPRAASNFRFFAHAITQFSSLCHDNQQALNYTLNQAVGPVACISPWNLPLYLLTWKIAPALAVGCSVVAKPSELTVLTANELAKLSIEAGIPRGVLNIIHGEGATAGNELCLHPDINAVSFTGGTQTGKHIASAIAPQFKKYSLELGGKNAALIFADCDYEKMLETTIRSSFTNQGEICLCTSRIFVEKSIYERFKQDFVARVRQIKMGPPLEDETQMGALISKSHLQKVSGFVEKAKQLGGTVLCGGETMSIAGKGFYHQATVIEGLSHKSEVNQHEIFGPVVCLMPFEDEEELLNAVNSTDYGLAATLWTQDISKGHRVANKIESGIVWVNCWMLRDLRTPFGGVKHSGVGREGGFDALQFFTQKKNICISL
jgi:aminomuconate-semialdehyde/2-hydroxymuconate-6-semialdehyde dehydrogenase